MANSFATNYPIVSGTTPAIFNVIWKLTRTMKAAGWTYKASSNGNQKDTSGIAANDLWGGNANPALDVYGYISTTSSGSQTLPSATINVASTAPSGIPPFPPSGTISIATSTNGWQNVTYTGITATSFTGCSGGTGTVPSTSSVSNGATTFNIENVNAWWVGSGPQTIKIPITAGPVGTPLRGETITQATSSAEGELIGFVFDTTVGSGWMVVLPRTGSFDNTHTITGSISAATFTPNGTLSVFNREVMFGKVSSSSNQGAIYYVCADALDGVSQTVNSTTVAIGSNGATLPTGTINVASTTSFPSSGSFLINTTVGLQLVTYTNTSGGNQFTGCSGGTGTLATGNSVTQSGVDGGSLLSTLATSAGCTTAVWPGGGGTNNGFPAIMLCVRGGGGNTSAGMDTILGGAAQFTTGANSQIATVNAISASGISPDGSFYTTVSATTVNAMHGFVYTRLDDSEPGDVDPYVWFITNSNTGSSWIRTSSTSYTGVPYSFSSAQVLGNDFYFSGYQARGLAGRDVTSGYASGVTSTALGGTYALDSNSPGSYRLVSHPSISPPVVREPFVIHTNAVIPGTLRQIKGRTRWMAAFSIGNTLDTFDTKTWLIVTAYILSQPSVGIGPYDGQTAPAP